MDCVKHNGERVLFLSRNTGPLSSKSHHKTFSETGSDTILSRSHLRENQQYKQVHHIFLIWRDMS